MSLTDTSIRNAKPGDKPKKLFDERGLFLLVQPSGGKLWRLKYRYLGKEKKLSLAPFPIEDKHRPVGSRSCCRPVAPGIGLALGRDRLSRADPSETSLCRVHRVWEAMRAFANKKTPAI